MVAAAMSVIRRTRWTKDQAGTRRKHGHGDNRVNQTVEMLNQAVELPADYPTWHRSADEEFVNAATHGFGLVAVLSARWS